MKIPADVVLLRSNGEMKVNNASLTGESDDLLRIVDGRGAPLQPNIFEAPNVAFFGTECTNGSGDGIVIRTGDATVMGLIAGLSLAAEAVETPLSKEIHRFILIVSSVAIFLGVTFFCFGVAYGYDYITNLVFAIGIIVANVPEGLLATVTVSLALTAKRMAKKKVLVKNLESVETLGSTSCICSDKTGTLTQNKMSLSNMFIDLATMDCSVNYQIYLNELTACKTDLDRKNVKRPDYLDKYMDPKNPDGTANVKSPGFQIMIETLALSTVSYFAYAPTNDVLRAGAAKIMGVGVN